MHSMQSKLPQVGTTIFTVMSKMAAEHGAINLSQGFPDFDPPEVLLEGLERATRGPFHQYAVTWGAPRFRHALAKKIAHFSGRDVDPESELVVTCGSTEAMMVAMMTACNPGDKVIVFSPFYENYAADAILSGAEPIYVPLRPPQFGFDPDELARAFAQGAKAIIVCNPSNPTGKVFTRAELQTILDLAELLKAAERNLSGCIGSAMRRGYRNQVVPRTLRRRSAMSIADCTASSTTLSSASIWCHSDAKPKTSRIAR